MKCGILTDFLQGHYFDFLQRTGNVRELKGLNKNTLDIFLKGAGASVWNAMNSADISQPHRLYYILYVIASYYFNGIAVYCFKHNLDPTLQQMFMVFFT
jgi:hypothetical protein